MESIDKKIVSVRVKSSNQQPTPPQVRAPLERPEALRGATYRIRPPGANHSLYMTVNDIVDNGKVRPFEVFLNSKDTKAQLWVTTVTVLMSALLRNCQDISFLVPELKSILDPEGGHWRPDGTRVGSIVAEIGYCLEKHLAGLAGTEVKAIPGAQQCGKCGETALVLQEGCQSCLACGYSKCS